MTDVRGGCWVGSGWKQKVLIPWGSSSATNPSSKEEGSTVFPLLLASESFLPLHPLLVTWVKTSAVDPTKEG
jgi:hypothetical protein